MAYIQRPATSGVPAIAAPGMLVRTMSTQEREEMIYSLFETLPRATLAAIRRRIDPLLNVDIVGSLPAEIGLEILSYLPWQSLLICSAVNRRWHVLAIDNSLWKRLCDRRGCHWKAPSRALTAISMSPSLSSDWTGDTDDEGVGDEEDLVAAGHDSGFASMEMDTTGSNARSIMTNIFSASLRKAPAMKNRHSSPSVLPTLSTLQPNYKLLHQTHTRIQNRILSSSYRLSTLQTLRPPAAALANHPHSSHTNTIYCLQLYTNPNTGIQTLFTGSKDKTIREWDINTSRVIRKVEGVHESSILSLCVHNQLLISAGSDRRVGVWDMNRNQFIKCIRHHEDSVLGVRFDDRRLVTCSKDRTVRTYLFPNLTSHLVLEGHRAAVNAVAISDRFIVSASGDRSMRVWDAETGHLLKAFEDHHTRGIASIVLEMPYVLSGSSDKHLRLIDLNTGKGWSTNKDYDSPMEKEADGDEDFVTTAAASTCGSCGTAVTIPSSADRVGETANRFRRVTRYASAHGNLVRSVVMGEHWVASGSYDSTVKIWNRATGAFVAELTGGHTGRIFCVGFDGTKVVSVGEDQRICIWDFAHGIDTSFIKL